VARRTKTMLLAAAGALFVAAPAEARLVYVTDPGARDAQVWIARDDGTQARRIGPGHSPKISPDGRWVAWVKDGSPDRLMMRLADRSRKARVVVRSPAIADLQFSPDSKLLGFVVGRRLSVYDIRERDEVKAASGSIRGFSFSPDSASVVFGTAGTSGASDAPCDLYSFSLEDKVRSRITRDRKSLNPLWGAAGILHDRMRVRGGDAPSYNVFTIKPDGGSLRRITTLRIPSLMSGLVPLEQSADGRRLLANFVGQDTRVAFRVNLVNGNAKALDDDFENGLVGFDLSADGRTVLGHTGGPDPTARHDVVTVPYGGGDAKVLVRRAGFPDWSL
jgi:Tol biopolymer transport system component